MEPVCRLYADKLAEIFQLRSGQGISVMMAGTVTEIRGLSPIRCWQNVAVTSLIVLVKSIRSIKPPFVGFFLFDRMPGNAKLSSVVAALSIKVKGVSHCLCFFDFFSREMGDTSGSIVTAS
jgi:hypothetical protein